MLIQKITFLRHFASSKISDTIYIWFVIDLHVPRTWNEYSYYQSVHWWDFSNLPTLYLETRPNTKVLSLLTISSLIFSFNFIFYIFTRFADMSYWLKSGQENLRRILAHRNNENRAKNIIIFIGDGMGISTITAGRIYKGQIKGNTGEEYKLAFEMFPNAGFAKVSYICNALYHQFQFSFIFF